MNCPKCNKRILQAVGNLESPLVILAESPYYEEIMQNKPFQSDNAEALKKELAKIGMQFGTYKMTYFWKHAEDEDCREWHATEAVKEIQKAKLVLVMGSDPGQTLYGVPDAWGVEMKSKFTKAKLVGCPGLATIVASPIGELRVAIEKFDQLKRRLK